MVRNAQRAAAPGPADQRAHGAGRRVAKFQFRGTGFVVGDGTLVVTNAHVVPEKLDAARRETFGFVVPGGGEGRALAAGSFPIFQLDATAYPGNSGSPVYDPATGHILGVVNMVLVRSTKESAISQPRGITYAVPARYLRQLLDQVR